MTRAALFAAYSVAAASVYLAPSVGFMVAAVGAFAMAAAVGVQYFLVFRSPWIVAGSAAGLGVVAWFGTRRAYTGSKTRRLRLILSSPRFLCVLCALR